MNNSIDTNALLLQLRVMAQEAGVPASNSLVPAETPAFSEIMQSTLQRVNASDESARELMESFELGNPDVELVDVMLAMQKARVSFEALTQVRNKMVAAYQDIMNMPI